MSNEDDLKDLFNIDHTDAKPWGGKTAQLTPENLEAGWKALMEAGARTPNNVELTSPAHFNQMLRDGEIDAAGHKPPCKPGRCPGPRVAR